ncbi:MAG: hypothetical protein ACREF0_10965 [Acetobacteraceae bacterium]
MSEQKIITELKVSGHLMKLETGIYCVFHAANGHAPNPATGLPGVRISLPPGSEAADAGVEISGFRGDGWVSTGHDAALIRVSNGPAQVLVTVYQSSLGSDALPQLQVVRLGEIRPNGVAAQALATPKPVPVIATAAHPVAAKDGADPRVIAHVQRRGDVQGALGEWMGERGSQLWIEGFSMQPPPEMHAEDLEYQAVLGRGWLSPWSQGGQFCGSRRMALPVLGLRVRLRGASAGAFECAYSASFTDGTMIGPVAAGEACEAENLAPLESFQVILRPRRTAARPAPAPAQPVAAQAVAARPAAGARSAGHPPGPLGGKRPERSPGKALTRRR